MNTKRWICLLVLLIQVTACGPHSAVQQDELVLAIGGESTEGYDPTLGWGRYGSPLFHSTLLKLDERLRVINDLARSYQISADGLTWLITIRTDARFSDGSPLTAEDVAYTFNKARTSGGKVDLAMLDRAVARDRSSVMLVLKYPYVTFINKLITLGIVPEHLHKNDNNYARHPVGSGPYRLVSWSEGQQLIVDENPYYYGKKPGIKRIVFLFMGEDTGFAAAKAGTVHVVALPHQLAKQKIKNMTIHPVRSVDNRGIVFPCVPDTGGKTAEGYPIGNNVTSDIAIRKAINYAIDRTLLTRTILEGYGEPAYGIADNLPWDEPGIRFKDNDIAKAKKILSDAGWKDTDGDGIVEKNGVKAVFTLLYYSTDSVRQQLALASADMVARIGVSINATGKSSDEITALHHSCAVLYGFGSYTPEEIYNIYHSKFAGIETYNVGFYADKTVDGYLDMAMSSPSLDRSLRYWKLAQWDGRTGLCARGGAPWAWLVNLHHIYFVSDKLDVGISKMEPHGHGWPITANIEKWKWKK